MRRYYFNCLSSFERTARVSTNLKTFSLFGENVLSICVVKDSPPYWLFLATLAYLLRGIINWW